MGILSSPKSQDKPTSLSAKRRSVPTDFANLKPLKPGGTLGFSSFRDTSDRSASLGSAKKKTLKEDSDMDSDEEEVGKAKIEKQEDLEVQEPTVTALSPDDAKRQGELAEGVQKIRVYDNPSVLVVGSRVNPTDADVFAVKATALGRTVECRITGHAKVSSIEHSHGGIYTPSRLTVYCHPGYPSAHEYF